MHVVADQKDTDAFGLELLDQVTHHRGFFRPQRGGRLIHDQDAGVEINRPRNRHHLALSPGEAAHRNADVGEVFVQALEHLAGVRVHAVVVQRAPAGQQLAAQKQIGHRVQVVGQRQGLVNRFDAQVLRIRRRADLHFFARQQHLAAVNRVGTGQHLHQRGFARAVVAQYGHHFAGIEVQTDVINR